MSGQETAQSDQGTTRAQPRQIDYIVARTLDDVVRGWRLVYNAYTRAGLIAENPWRLHTVPQAIGPRTLVTLAVCGEREAGTISAYGETGRGLPLDSVYADELAELRQSGRRMVEVGLFADCRADFGRSAENLLDLMRFAYHFCLCLDATDVIIGVHPHHARFYTRLIGFERIGAERTYPLVKDHPVVLLRLDLAASQTRQPRPRGIAHFLKYPVPHSAYETRFHFDPASLAGSDVERFLAQRRKSLEMGAAA